MPDSPQLLPKPPISAAALFPDNFTQILSRQHAQDNIIVSAVPPRRSAAGPSRNAVLEGLGVIFATCDNGGHLNHFPTMKKILLIGLLVLLVLYVFKRMVYKPFMWQRRIKTPEHRLQLGSYIFSRVLGSNGSQSPAFHYYIYKVIEIHGDHVRLAVVRQLSMEGGAVGSVSSMTRKDFAQLKKKIHLEPVIGILREDLYRKKAQRHAMNDYLTQKYPALSQARYYFQDIPEDEKNGPAPTEQYDRMYYFESLYSKKEIIEKGGLRRWLLNSRQAPELSRTSENIELLQNPPPAPTAG